MKIGFATVSIATGFVLVAVYYVVGWRCRRYPSLHNCITAILAGSGAVCGVTLALAPMVESFKALVVDLDLYLAIGGFAVLYVSLHEFWKARPRATAEAKDASEDAEDLPIAEPRESVESSRAS